MAQRVVFHGIEKLTERLHSLQGGVADLDFAELDLTLEELRVTQEALLVAKEEADQERARYFEIFEFAPDPYVVTSRTGRIKEANRAMALFVGVDWLIGKPLAVYVDAKDHVLFAHILSQMRHTLRGEWTFRMRLRGKTERIAHVTAGAVRGADGEVSAIRWMIRDVTEQQHAEQELRASRRRLRLMASKLALVEERERRRIAGDLHDHISQSLAVAKLRLGMLREAVPHSHKPALDEVRTLLSQVIAQTRTLTFELSPAVLYELGLAAAIEWLLEQRGGYGIQFEFKNESPELRLKRDTAITLFQAIREVLANIIKHSQATRATFRLYLDGGKVRIEAHDNGTGFAVEETLSRKPQELGLGLVSMRERIVHLGGSVEIQSEPGNGTRVLLSAPLDAAKKKTSPRRPYAIERDDSRRPPDRAPGPPGPARQGARLADRRGSEQRPRGAGGNGNGTAH